jgi:DNA invertase Pin-like site-specific DNA recombinase
MRIGYARTSTDDQKAGLEAQKRDLEAAGCKRVYSEHASSVGERPKFDKALDFLDEGDLLVVTKLDRLARSVRGMFEILDQIEKRKAGLVILGMNLDTTTATGRLMLNVLGSVAEFERDMMLERQKEGIAKAKAEGRFMGKRPSAFAKADEIRALAAKGLKPMAISRELGIKSRTSIYNVLEATPAEVAKQKEKLKYWKGEAA